MTREALRDPKYYSVLITALGRAEWDINNQKWIKVAYSKRPKRREAAHAILIGAILKNE